MYRRPRREFKFVTFRYILGMFFIKQPVYYAIGVILGTAVSVARFVMLEKTLNKSVDMAPADAQNYTRLQYFLRMAVIAVVAVIAAKVRYIDLLGFIIGLLPVSPAIHIRGLLNRGSEDGEQQL